ncbi:MAG: hypothetical protein ACOYIR_03465 [Christensenellales bacterium]|jgi:hypothetical protein
MGLIRWARLVAFLAVALCCSLLPGCSKRTRPELVLAPRPSLSPAPKSSAEPAPKESDSASKKDPTQEAWFFLHPAEDATALCGSFATSLPEETTIHAELCVAPLGGQVVLTDTLTVKDGVLCYDFSSRLPRSAIDRQYAMLTLCLRFADPQPEKLTDAFGATGEKLAEGFVIGKVLSSRVEMQFALPFPDAESVADLEAPSFSNPSDLVFTTSHRYHTNDCRYAASAQPAARAYAQSLGLDPCAVCHP